MEGSAGAHAYDRGVAHPHRWLVYIKTEPPKAGGIMAAKGLYCADPRGARDRLMIQASRFFKQASRQAI